MQRICIGFLFCIMIITNAIAADLCVRNDAMFVALSPDSGGTAQSSNATGLKTWSTRFNYGIISGIAACYGSVACENGGSNAGCIATNQNLSSFGAGGKCYCKMLKPALSMWVYYMWRGDGGGGESVCPGSCASWCASGVATSLPLRQGLFGSVNRLD